MPPETALSQEPDADPDLTRALATAVAEGWEVLVDFDHTLFSSNSTELFLASARPAFLASIVLGLVRGVFPWFRYSSRWGRLRDYVSVLAILGAMPWTLLVWRWRGPALFRTHAVHAIADALRAVPAERTAIISFGLTPLIRPLLRGSRWERSRLVSVPVPCHPRTLVTGKLQLITASRPLIDPARAAFVTDSEDDRDLLDASGAGYLIPRQGKRVLADARLYLPWRYASIGKYGRAWTLDLVLYVDLVLAFLATGVIASGSLLAVLATLMLFTSLHGIYEIGYFENDFHAAVGEAEPTLIPNAELFRGFPLERHAWLWAGVLGVAGCGLLAAAEGGGWPAMGAVVAVWVAVLGATRAVFYAYNRQPSARRLFLYPFLQACKSFGLLAVLPAPVLGVALLSAQVLTMSMNYTVYRVTGIRAGVPREEFRLITFVVVGVGLALVRPAVIAEAGPMTLACMASWLVWRIYRFRVRAWIRAHRAPRSVDERRSFT